METISNINIPKNKLADFCRENHIIKLSLFGSVLTERFRPDSDVDILVEFDPEHVPGLFSLTSMEMELGEILKRKVDLRLPGELSRYFRQEVMEKAEVQYAKG